MTLAGRLALVAAFGTSLPYLDQWKVTGVDVLEPWANGTLGYDTFFQPINDHWNVLARLYSFGLILLNGRWNNLVEITGNALICAAIVGVLVRHLSPLLPRLGALAFAAFCGTVFALPFGWENTLMGVQTDLFLQVLFTLLFFRAMLLAERCDSAWWIGVGLAGLSFYTQRSAVLAIPVAAAVLAWRLWSDRERAPQHLRSLAACAALLGLYFATTPTLAETISMGSSSWPIFLDAFLRQLAWPLPHPAWVLLFFAPGCWLVVDRLGRGSITPRESLLFAVGLWAVAQASAIAFARGDVTPGFASRYCDLLAFGFVANALSLGLLWREARSRRLRLGLAALALAWSAAGGLGLWRESTAGHAGHNLSRRPAVNESNHAAVRDYLATGDPSHLAIERIGAQLYSYPPELRRLLDQPRIQAVLPVGTPSAQPALEGFVDATLRFGPELALAAALALAVALLRRRGDEAPPEPPPPGRPRRLWPLAVAASFAVLALLATWPRPFTLDRAERWRRATKVAGHSATPVALDFRTVVGRSIVPNQLRGAVAINPPEARADSYGTLLAEGFSYTGIVRTASFTVTRDFLFVPVTGWPCWSGNAVRWHLRDPATGKEQWLPLVGDPFLPRHDILPWTVSVREFRGWEASLYLFDGSAEETGGWVGVLPAIQTAHPDVGIVWQRNVLAKRTAATHHLLLGLNGLLLVVWTGYWLYRPRRRKRTNTRKEPAPRTEGRAEPAVLVN